MLSSANGLERPIEITVKARVKRHGRILKKKDSLKTRCGDGETGLAKRALLTGKLHRSMNVDERPIASENYAVTFSISMALRQ